MEEAPSMSWTKAEMIEYAEEHELEVSDDMTKAEILSVIEDTEVNEVTFDAGELAAKYIHTLSSGEMERVSANPGVGVFGFRKFINDLPDEDFEALLVEELEA